VKEQQLSTNITLYTLPNLKGLKIPGCVRDEILTKESLEVFGDVKWAEGLKD
jgi:hypothetical protein